MVLVAGRGRAGAAILFGAAALGACSRAPTVSPRPETRTAPSRAESASPRRPRPDNPADVLPAAPDLPTERRAIEVTGGVERVVDADAARARGLTVVDLSDGWAPSVFADGVGPGGASLANGYRSIYTGLASDHSDGDGQPLARGEHNYVELYGVPPSLSVLRRRFLDDARRRCPTADDAAKLLAVDEIQTWGAATESKELARRAARAARLEAARKGTQAATLEALAESDPRYGKDVAATLRFEAEREAFGAVERRLACEGLLDPAKHKAGAYDTAMRTAMLDFQQKQAVMDQADIRTSTLEALARSPLQNDFLALGRALTERAMHAGGFVEDGSAKSPGDVVGPTYLGADGARHEVPDLATPALAAVLARLDLDTPEDALAFFRRHPRADFDWLKLAVRLPAPPEYYGKTMELGAEIDRGDVWYDFPFDAKGVRLPQPRDRFPSFTLFVKWRGERVPLVRWRTTVGGWRVELASDGQEYFRYKGSDIGPRVWRHIVAAPVWIPPPSSPLASMVKQKRVNGSYVRVTNYDETGPGYLSAYGLAAAIHEEMRRGANGPTFFDNGIRTHGSFDYLSLRGRFSHGCHRLYNQLAMRLFSFVLGHRHVRTLGPISLGFRRTFYFQGEVYEMRLPTRGFYYELDPPLPVNVLEGTIKGTLQKPIAGYVQKPGVKYASSRPPAAGNEPEERAGGD